MQECVTLSPDSPFSVRKTVTVDGHLVPWEVSTYIKDFETAETAGGIFDLSDWGVVEIAGPDAKDYLQRMSTVDLRSLAPGAVVRAAFLTGRGLILSHGFLRSIPQGYFYYVAPGQSAAACEHLEKFHFAENLTVRDVSNDWSLFGFWKIAALGSSTPLSAAPLKAEVGHLGSSEIVSWQDDIRSQLIWVTIERRESLRFLSSVKVAGIELLGQRLFEFYRIRGGIPKIGVEASEKDIILETGFDRVISRNKGCYPGQEVVERIFTYGRVNRNLVPVSISRASDASWPQLPLELRAEGKGIGNLMSFAENPVDSETALGLAYVHKNYLEWSSPFESQPGLSVTLRRANLVPTR